MPDGPDEIPLPPSARQLWQRFITAARATAEAHGAEFSKYQVAGDRLVRSEPERSEDE